MNTLIVQSTKQAEDVFGRKPSSYRKIYWGDQFAYKFFFKFDDMLEALAFYDRNANFLQLFDSDRTQPLYMDSINITIDSIREFDRSDINFINALDNNKNYPDNYVDYLSNLYKTVKWIKTITVRIIISDIAR